MKDILKFANLIIKKIKGQNLIRQKIEKFRIKMLL